MNWSLEKCDLSFKSLKISLETSSAWNKNDEKNFLLYLLPHILKAFMNAPCFKIMFFSFFVSAGIAIWIFHDFSPNEFHLT